MSNKNGSGQFAFSGRTIGKGLRKRSGGGNASSERRGLRSKTQPQPYGKNRFPCGFRYRAQGEWVVGPDGKERYVESEHTYPGC